jgi:hypothetical protein
MIIVCVEMMIIVEMNKNVNKWVDKWIENSANAVLVFIVLLPMNYNYCLHCWHNNACLWSLINVGMYFCCYVRSFSVRKVWNNLWGSWELFILELSLPSQLLPTKKSEIKF